MPPKVKVGKPRQIQPQKQEESPFQLFLEIPPLPKKRGFMGRCCVIIADDFRKKFHIEHLPVNGTHEKWEDWVEFFKREKV